MKFGLRKPSLKKSFKARTTGKLKRKIKKSLKPGYGKKGMGVFHPKKAVYNRVYRRTTFSIWQLLNPFKWIEWSFLLLAKSIEWFFNIIIWFLGRRK